MDALDIPRLRGVTHAYAFWCALVAAVVLIAFAPGGAPRAAAAVYGAGLCALFGGSAGSTTAGAGIRAGGRSCAAIDHSTIFVFIAACYTPVGAARARRAPSAGRAVTVWAGALGGVALSVAWITAPRALVRRAATSRSAGSRCSRCPQLRVDAAASRRSS